MSTKRKKSPLKIKNTELAILATEDPTRFKQRTVKPKKGRGRKKRPRDNNRTQKENG